MRTLQDIDEALSIFKTYRGADSTLIAAFWDFYKNCIEGTELDWPLDELRLRWMGFVAGWKRAKGVIYFDPIPRTS